MRYAEREFWIFHNKSFGIYMVVDEIDGQVKTHGIFESYRQAHEFLVELRENVAKNGFIKFF